MLVDLSYNVVVKKICSKQLQSFGVFNKDIHKYSEQASKQMEKHHLEINLIRQ